MINKEQNRDIITLNTNNKKENSKNKNNKGRILNFKDDYNPIETNVNLLNDGKQKNEEINIIELDNLEEKNKGYEEIINNALFSQLSKINVKILNFDEEATRKYYKNIKGKTLPKIHYVEYTLLDQSSNISELKEFGFGIYVFFFYLKNIILKKTENQNF